MRRLIGLFKYPFSDISYIQCNLKSLWSYEAFLVLFFCLYESAFRWDNLPIICWSYQCIHSVYISHPLLLFNELLVKQLADLSNASIMYISYIYFVHNTTLDVALYQTHYRSFQNIRDFNSKRHFCHTDVVEHKIVPGLFQVLWRLPFGLPLLSCVFGVWTILGFLPFVICRI